MSVGMVYVCDVRRLLCGVEFSLSIFTWALDHQVIKLVLQEPLPAKPSH